MRYLKVASGKAVWKQPMFKLETARQTSNSEVISCKAVIITGRASSRDVFMCHFFSFLMNYSGKRIDRAKYLTGLKVICLIHGDYSPASTRVTLTVAVFWQKVLQSKFWTLLIFSLRWKAKCKAMDFIYVLNWWKNVLIPFCPFF